jgi:hypothetical protein
VVTFRFKAFISYSHRGRDWSASLAARLELMRGNKSLAKGYTSYLLDKVYYEPGFVASCQRYDLCDD